MIDWQQITVRKPKAVTMPMLGRRARDKQGRTRALSDSERAKIMRDLKHSLCVEHVPLRGYRQPVCIMRGQDSETVIADAIELLRQRRPRRAERRVLWLRS